MDVFLWIPSLQYSNVQRMQSNMWKPWRTPDTVYLRLSDHTHMHKGISGDYHAAIQDKQHACQELAAYRLNLLMTYIDDLY